MLRPNPQFALSGLMTLDERNSFLHGQERDVFSDAGNQEAISTDVQSSTPTT